MEGYKHRTADALLDRKLKGNGAVVIEGPKWCGKASFSVNGHRAPTIGNICMDMCMLDVTGIPCAVGDTVTIFGADPTITELAERLGTIPYEILTSVPRRIERVVVRKA